MNRFRSSSLLFPASLLLLLASSCKGPSNEAETTEPFEYSYDDEVDPLEDPYDDAVEPESEPALDPEQADPPAGAAPEAAAEPPPDSPSPAPPPPPTTARGSSSGSSLPDDGLTSNQRLEEALRKDADTDMWGVEPYMRHKESLKPRIRDNYVFLLAGSRELTDDAWGNVDSPATGGINYLAKGPGGWFHWDVAFSYGSDDGTAADGNGNTVSVESTIWEVDLGLAKMFAIGEVVRPYIGLGVAYMRAGGQVTTPTGPVDDTGNSFAGYGRVGLAFDITQWGGLIGIDARYVGGSSVSFGSVDTNADGFVGSITFGYSW